MLRKLAHKSANEHTSTKARLFLLVPGTSCLARFSLFAGVAFIIKYASAAVAAVSAVDVAPRHLLGARIFAFTQVKLNGFLFPSCDLAFLFVLAENDLASFLKAFVGLVSQGVWGSASQVQFSSVTFKKVDSRLNSS